MTKQASETHGPHHLAHSQQERCAVEGYRIDGSGPCTVIAIRDRAQRGWILYPHGNTGFRVLLAYDAAHTLADRTGSPPHPASACVTSGHRAAQHPDAGNPP